MISNKKNNNISTLRIGSIVLVCVLFALILIYNLFAMQYETKKSRAFEDLRVMKLALEAYKLKNSMLPETLSSLEGNAIIPRVPLDPWDNEYRLTVESTGEAGYYAVFSSGPDKNAGEVTFEDGVLKTTDRDDIGVTNAVLPKGNNNWR